MSAGISVAATGSALAFLLYENGNSRNNQAGFLLGDVVSEKKNLISDSDYREEKTETVVHVHAVLQAQSLSSMYSISNNDCVNKYTLGSNKNSIVGWYSFRRNVTAVPTLRDRLLHTQLLDEFKGNPENFLFCLLTSSVNSDTWSHSFRQHFLVYNPSSRKYEAVPLLIKNLANVNSQYRGPPAPTCDRLLQRFTDPSWRSLELVDKLHKKLINELHGAVSTLVETEERVEETESQLLQLKEERDAMVKRHRESASKVYRVRDEEMKMAQEREMESRHQANQAGDGGENVPKSVEIVCISDDESPTSPVLGSTSVKRLTRNIPKQ